MTTVAAFGAAAADKPLEQMQIVRRAVREEDVRVNIEWCGVCHSDLHTARNEWKDTVSTIYPIVPGHEIVGTVAEVGAKVTKFKAGDVVGVGCFVDSCRGCGPCKGGLEQYCENGFTGTYGGVEKGTGDQTQGGYSKSVVVDQSYVLRVPTNIPKEQAAPLLCAGITTYSPLRKWGVKAGMKVGIVGLGGLGHMGLKFAKAMGAYPVLFTTSPSKIEDAKRLGAAEVVISKDPAQMAAHFSSFDFILDCVAADHDINAFLQLLKLDATLVLVGAPEQPLKVGAFPLIFKRRNLAGSLIGGIAETQEMLDFCGAHGIGADVEVIKMADINTAYERMLRSDVKYRFSIDMSTLQ
jgi:uncharacterized zinc-type alcohol dehydrogenase-like protein